MAQGNPYSLVFGKEPLEVIPRFSQTDEIIQCFSDDPPSQQICMITGVRGSGKTVHMTTISKHFQTMKDWIVVELNSDSDMLKSLAAKLTSDHALARIFQGAKINLSYFGIGLGVQNEAVPITDIETAISRMLMSLKKKRKKVLITVDEVTDTPQMRVFASTFQILIRQDLPLCLIMTGLYENIYQLQNEKALTFLYRAPKIHLGPLNIGVIAENYKSVLGLSSEKAMQMAKLTKGYSFAFQVLGHFTWQYRDDEAKVMSSFKQYLQEYSYEKIWAELSAGDRKAAWAIAQSSDGRVQEIRQILGMESNEFSPYRERMIRKGIVSGDERGYLRFTLPLFDQFVLERI